MRDAALAEHVAEDVERSHGRGCGRDVHERVVDVVAPDAHVHVRAFALDGVVPAVGDDVAVDIGIAVGAALETVVAAPPMPSLKPWSSVERMVL